MEFDLKSIRMKRVVNTDELDEFEQRSIGNLNYKKSKNKSDIAFKKIMEGNIKDF